MPPKGSSGAAVWRARLPFVVFGVMLACAIVLIWTSERTSVPPNERERTKTQKSKAASAASASPPPIAPVAPPVPSVPPRRSQVKVLESYSHNPESFTQGLSYYNERLYEGTGMYRESSVHILSITSGEALKSHKLDERLFGEGLTVMDGKIYQLTWHERVAFIYDAATLTRTRAVEYPYEGWGLTHNPTTQHLIASDGTDKIYFLSHTDFSLIRTITVKEVHPNGRDTVPIRHINEMEFISGFIYANLWLTNRIAIIDPESGFVVHYLVIPDSLYPGAERTADATGSQRRSGPQSGKRPADMVANGIAFDANTQRLWITGKWWNKLYQIEYTPPQQLIDSS